MGVNESRKVTYANVLVSERRFADIVVRVKGIVNKDLRVEQLVELEIYDSNEVILNLPFALSQLSGTYLGESWGRRAWSRQSRTF